MKLKNLIPNKDKWTQGYYALDKNNVPIPSYEIQNKKPKCYCLNGAIIATCARHEWVLSSPEFTAKTCQMSQIIKNLFPDFVNSLATDYMTRQGACVLIARFNDVYDFSDIEKVIEEFDRVY